MIADNIVYFQFKNKVQFPASQPIYLHEIVELFCGDEIRQQIGDTIIIEKQDKTPIIITAVDIIKIIKDRLPNILVLLVGQGKILIQPSDDHNSKDKSIVLWIKLAATVILLFVGSGLAIMNFHADVNMHQVHQIIYTAVTGQQVKKPYWISIPYSIGIGVGIGLFFDIFSLNKKAKNPDPLEMEMYRYEKDVNSYIEDGGTKKDKRA